MKLHAYQKNRPRKTLGMASAALLALCAAAGGSVHAQSATVTFTGTLNVTTCTASISGSSVALDQIVPADLPALNTTAKEKLFYVNLSACSGSGVRAKAEFWQSGAIGGIIRKTSGVGDGWGYQLLYGGTGNTPIYINAYAGVMNGSDPGVVMNGAASYNIPYRVRYYRVGTLVGGALSATANYQLYYQ